jgi:hypothetical protein
MYSEIGFDFAAYFGVILNWFCKDNVSITRLCSIGFWYVFWVVLNTMFKVSDGFFMDIWLHF